MGLCAAEHDMNCPCAALTISTPWPTLLRLVALVGALCISCTLGRNAVLAGYVRDPRTSLAERTLAGVSIVNRTLKWTRQHLIIVDVVTVWTRRCTLFSIVMSCAIGNARDCRPKRPGFEPQTRR